MRNIKMKVEKNVLQITINLTEQGQLSASGKSLVIATTQGNVQVPGAPEVKIGINCYKPAHA